MFEQINTPYQNIAIAIFSASAKEHSHSAYGNGTATHHGRSEAASLCGADAFQHHTYRSNVCSISVAVAGACACSFNIA